jgi:hypothetical protein
MELLTELGNHGQTQGQGQSQRYMQHAASDLLRFASPHAVSPVPPPYLCDDPRPPPECRAHRLRDQHNVSDCHALYTHRTQDAECLQVESHNGAWGSRHRVKVMRPWYHMLEQYHMWAHGRGGRVLGHPLHNSKPLLAYVLLLNVTHLPACLLPAPCP